MSMRSKLLTSTMAILSLAVPAVASSVLPADFSQLSQNAENVIGGVITSITPSQDADTGYIYSTVTVLVSHAVPAEIAGDEYSFKMIGGTLNGKELYIADFPKFSVDDTVILFLNSETSSVLGPTIGLWQGVFFVDTKQAGNAVVTDHLRRPIVGVKDRQLILSAGASGSGGTNALSTTSGSRGLDLDEFFREVESHRSSSGQ